MPQLIAPLFPLCPSYGSVTTPTYSTRIVGSGTGWESRNADWEHPRNQFNAALTVQNQMQLDQLISFFHAMRGSAFGFRLKDENDYKSCSILDTPAFDDQVVVASAIEGQNDIVLTKTYTEASDTHSTVRIISQPLEPSVLIGVGADLGSLVELTAGVGFNMVDGKVVLTTPLTAGQILTAGYEYFLPMRFEEDTLPVVLSSYLNGDASVPSIETRVKTT